MSAGEEEGSEKVPGGRDEFESRFALPPSFRPSFSRLSVSTSIESIRDWGAREGGWL